MHRTGFFRTRRRLCRPAVVRVVVTVVCVVPQLCAQQPGDLTDKERAAVDRSVEEFRRKNGVVGLAIGIIRQGRVVYTQGYGFADRESKSRVQPAKTMFRWASVSKPVTAIAAMQLVQSGKLNLDADVRTYVPEFPKKGHEITTRQLLCHQSGIVHYSNGRVIRTKRRYKSRYPFRNVVTALDRFKDSPLVNRPGEKVSYSSHAYILLSAVVERAGRQPFAEQVSQRIVKPLGLKTLQPDYQWKKIPNRAVGYRKFGNKIVRSTNTDVSWKLGGGGFISTVDDLAGFASGLINRKLVNAKTEKMIWTPQKTADGAATAWGLGFGLSPQNGLKVHHSGSQEKTKTRMVTYPRARHGVVMMTNSEWVDPGTVTTLVYRAMR